MTTPAIKNIHHLAIAVHDIEEALTFWRDALGLELEQVQDVESQAVKIAILPVKDSEIELIEPTTEDSGVKRFMEKRGAGIHHICLEVDDIEAMLEDLKARNVRLINETPQEDGIAGRKFAFIHPESAHGVLVELYQLPKD
jgi:methylmalonyl-CoA/ethylmalonyl-CoA epimerase